MSKWPALLSFLPFDSEAVLFWSYLPFNCFVTFVFRVMSKLLWWCLARVMKPQWVFTPGLTQEFENVNSCIQLVLLSPVWINDHWKGNISKMHFKVSKFYIDGVPLPWAWMQNLCQLDSETTALKCILRNRWVLSCTVRRKFCLTWKEELNYFKKSFPTYWHEAQRGALENSGSRHLDLSLATSRCHLTGYVNELF